MDVKVLILLLLAHPTLLLAAPRQYHLVSQALSWYDAQSYCREKFLDLATIGSAEDQAQVSELITASSVTASHKWIGLYTTKDWRWSMNNTYLDMGSSDLEGWFVFSRDNYQYKEHCAVINQTSLYDVNCELLYKSVCYDGPSDSYVPVTTPMTWLSAQSYCRETFTDLTSMRSQQELNSITSVIDNVTAWWVGLYQEDWRWSDQSNSSFRSWAGGEPKGSMCAAVWGNRRWDDTSCGSRLPFICSAQQLKILKIVLKAERSVDLNDTMIHGAIRDYTDKLLKDQGVVVLQTWRKQNREKLIFIKPKYP